MIDATIAIITYKRPVWLLRLLKSLAGQEFGDNLKIEFLVVDNACEKETEKIVNKVGDSFGRVIHYIAERKKGIVAARNTAVAFFLKSSSKNLLFIDDDEWPQRNDWAQTMVNMREACSADIVVGPVFSVCESSTPKWAVDLLYGHNSLVNGQVVKVFYTGNLLISRPVLEKIYPAFDRRFAMTGASDYHFALKCFHAGFKAVYVDAAVKEEFPRSRATVSWFIRRGFRSGIGYTRSHLYEERWISAVVRCLLMSIVRLVRGTFNITFGFFTFSKLRCVDGLFRIGSSVGTIAGFFGVKYNEYTVTHGK